MYSPFVCPWIIVCASYVSGSLFVLAICLWVTIGASNPSQGSKQMISVLGSKCIPVVCHMGVV